MIDLNDVSPPTPTVRYDLDAIAERLRERAESWVPQLFPNGTRKEDEWRLANIRGDAPRKIGSCVITLKGEHAGDWKDFDGNQKGGGPLSAIEQATGLTGRELFAYAAELVGWSQAAPQKQMPASVSKPEKDSAREIDIILSRTQAIHGTLIEIYFESRGLSCPATPDLLFHPDLAHWDTKTGYPAMVSIVRDADGKQQALHRTYLKPDGSGKADVSKAKKMLGRTVGGAVRLAPIGENGVLGLTEGIETALAVMTARPDLPVWAALSAPGLEQIKLPPEAKRIVILADHDASGAGQRAAEALADRLLAEGRECAIAMPDKEGEDFNDLLRRAGADGIKRCLQAAQTHERTSLLAPKADNATRRGLPIGFADPEIPLPLHRTDEGNLDRAARQTWLLLHKSNLSPWLYRVGSVPSWVVPDDDGLPMVRGLTDERLRYMLAKIADWRKLSANNQLVPAHPPSSLVKALLATPDPVLPVLAGVVTAPVFGRNGELITDAGYHPDARLLYHPLSGFSVPPVPRCPTKEEIAAARTLILDDLMGDFPFVGEAERAHAVALLLLGFVRAMIEGPTPLHLIEKPTPGTGATLLVDAIATILTGSGASVMTEGSEDEEWRKRLTAKLRQIPALVLIDNLRRTLDSSALAAALTAPFWEDRILGVSEMTRLPIRCVWIATGNNPEFSNEMSRRLIRIRLDAHVDRPARRQGFRHPDLMVWVRANRASLVSACLTLCQAWIAAGRPSNPEIIGSYENWSRVMGGVLQVVGIEGFLANIDEMMEASDAEGAMWRGFVSLWWDRFGTAEVGSGDLYELALVSEPALPLGAGGDHSRKIRLGKALRRVRDRMFDLGHIAVRVAATGPKQRAMCWQLAVVEQPTCGATVTEKHSPHSLHANEKVSVAPLEPQHSLDTHSNSDLQNQIASECGECSECFSHPIHARGHARAQEEGAQKHSQYSQHSPTRCEEKDFRGECAGECPHPSAQHSLTQDETPDWLKEALP